MRKRSFLIHAHTLRLFGALLVLTMAVPLGIGATAAQDAAITTRVQVLHAGPDLGQVEIHINDEEVADEFEYGNTSGWFDLDPGSVRFTITVDRAGFNYVIFDSVYPVPAGNDYYVVITDALVLGGVFDTEPVMIDGSRVQITHASVDTPPVNVVATGDNVSLASELGFGRTSDTSPLPAGAYDIEVSLADTGDVLATVPSVTIESGKSYQLVVVGTPGDEDTPLTVMVLETDLSESGTPTA
jgi:Domain of unknown function (DUF4397)